MSIKKTNTRLEKKTSKKAIPGKKVKLSRDEKYRLYLGSVQNPEADIQFINKEYKAIFGKTPKSLREDFCVTTLDMDRTRVIIFSKNNFSRMIELSSNNKQIRCIIFKGLGNNHILLHVLI